MAAPVVGVPDTVNPTAPTRGGTTQPRRRGKVTCMSKSAFYSFHYDQDNWRVQQIINMGVLEGQPLLGAQKWEEVERQGETAIQNWIARQMSGKSAVVVLVGAQTASRPWVKYEIAKAWNDKIPLLGVRIHGMKDRAGSTDSQGANPFADISLTGGGKISDFVTLKDPAGATSTAVYATIQDNLVSWVDLYGYRRS